MTKLLFEHVVVLMLENRSFDHLFGYLGIGEGLDRHQCDELPQTPQQEDHGVQCAAWRRLHGDRSRAVAQP